MDICPTCNAPLRLAVGKYVCTTARCEFLRLAGPEDGLWATALAADEAYWFMPATEYPTVIAGEYAQLRERLHAGQSYAALLQLKELLELLLKFPTLTAACGIYQTHERNKEQNEILAGLLQPRISLQHWHELGRRVFEIDAFSHPFLKEIHRDVLELFGGGGRDLALWRAETIARGALAFQCDDSFRNDIEEKLGLIRDHFARLDAAYSKIVLLQNDDGAVILSGEAPLSLHPYFSWDEGSLMLFEGFDPARNRTRLRACLTGKESSVLNRSEETELVAALRRAGLFIAADENREDPIRDALQEGTLQGIADLHDYHEPEHLVHWLKEALLKNDRGIFLLQMPPESGKSTFVQALDELGTNKIDLPETTVRAHYLLADSKSYFSAILAHELHERIIRGRDGARLFNLDVPLPGRESEDKRQKMAEFLNASRRAYEELNGSKRLIVAIDGLDKLSPDMYESIFDYLPEQHRLHEGVYVLLTCVTRPANFTLRRALQRLSAKVKVVFGWEDDKRAVFTKRATAENYLRSLHWSYGSRHFALPKTLLTHLAFAKEPLTVQELEYLCDAHQRTGPVWTAALRDIRAMLVAEHTARHGRLIRLANPPLKKTLRAASTAFMRKQLDAWIHEWCTADSQQPASISDGEAYAASAILDLVSESSIKRAGPELTQALLNVAESYARGAYPLRFASHFAKLCATLAEREPGLSAKFRRLEAEYGFRASSSYQAITTNFEHSLKAIQSLAADSAPRVRIGPIWCERKLLFDLPVDAAGGVVELLKRAGQVALFYAKDQRDSSYAGSWDVHRAVETATLLLAKGGEGEGGRSHTELLLLESLAAGLDHDLIGSRNALYAITFAATRRSEKHDDLALMAHVYARRAWLNLLLNENEKCRNDLLESLSLQREIFFDSPSDPEHHFPASIIAHTANVLLSFSPSDAGIYIKRVLRFLDGERPAGKPDEWDLAIPRERIGEPLLQLAEAPGGLAPEPAEVSFTRGFATTSDERLECLAMVHHFNAEYAHLRGDLDSADCAYALEIETRLSLHENLTVGRLDENAPGPLRIFIDTNRHRLAYAHERRGDASRARGDVDGAREAYELAVASKPEVLRYWHVDLAPARIAAKQAALFPAGSGGGAKLLSYALKNAAWQPETPFGHLLLARISLQRARHHIAGGMILDAALDISRGSAALLAMREKWSTLIPASTLETLNDCAMAVVYDQVNAGNIDCVYRNLKELALLYTVPDAPALPDQDGMRLRLTALLAAFCADRVEAQAALPVLVGPSSPRQPGSKSFCFNLMGRKHAEKLNGAAF